MGIEVHRAGSATTTQAEVTSNEQLAVFLGDTTDAGLSGAQRSWRFLLPSGLMFVTDQGFPRMVSNTFPIGPDFGDTDGHGFYFVIRPFEAAPNSVLTATWDLDIRLVC